MVFKGSPETQETNNGDPTKDTGDGPQCLQGGERGSGRKSRWDCGQGRFGNMDGWGKIKEAASYAGVSPRTVEDWLKQGLKCSHLPSGLRLIKFQWVDEFLERFADSLNRADQIVDEVLRKI
jgi:excisionase family DNA binding protein